VIRFLAVVGNMFPVVQYVGWSQRRKKNEKQKRKRNSQYLYRRKVFAEEISDAAEDRNRFLPSFEKRRGNTWLN